MEREDRTNLVALGMAALLLPERTDDPAGGRPALSPLSPSAPYPHRASGARLDPGNGARRGQTGRNEFGASRRACRLAFGFDSIQGGFRDRIRHFARRLIR